MDLSPTTQFLAGCGLVLIPFAVLAGVAEAALRGILCNLTRTQ